MQPGEVVTGTRYGIANLSALTGENIASMNSNDRLRPAHPLFLFRQDYLDNRAGRLLESGIVERFYPGHQVTVFVLRHDDDSVGVYHCSELCAMSELAQLVSQKKELDQWVGAVAATPAAVSAETAATSFAAFQSVTIGAVQVDFFAGADATSMTTDCLICAVPDYSSGKSSSPLLDAITDVAGEYYARTLDSAMMAPQRAYLLIGEDERAKQAAFHSVAFMARTAQPMIDMMYSLLAAVHVGASVVVPIGEFLPQEVMTEQRGAIVNHLLQLLEHNLKAKVLERLKRIVFVF